MQVIRRALIALYSGTVADIRSSTDLVAAIPEVMDRALAGSSCPFQTYRESARAFAHTLYQLRIEDGKCVTPGTPAGCGFYDPYNQYRDPPLSTITYAGADQTYRDTIGSSFGIDLIDVHLDQTVDGQPLTLEFYVPPGSGVEFDVQLWRLVDPSEGTVPRSAPTETTAVGALIRMTSAKHLFYVIPAIRTTAYNKLGLIITRLDAQEASDPIGEYTIVLSGRAS
jgi:hypothetical protein